MTVLNQCDITGSRLIGAITELGHLGPKHHAIVLGQSLIDGKVYIAEKMINGEQITTFDDFNERYQKNGEIKILPNDGNFSDIEVAQRALNEITKKTGRKYDLIANNCESFSNRAMHGHSTSSQVINTVIGCLILAGGIWMLREGKSS